MDSSGFVEVTITSNFNSFQSIRRFPGDTKIAELKIKLQLLTGSTSELMRIQLLDKNRAILCDSLEDDKDLNSYANPNGVYLHVVDPSHRSGEFEDLSTVPKFNISDESYSQRKDTFRAFKEQHQGGMGESVLLEQEGKIAKGIHVGDRCEVRLANQPHRRGVVRFVGTTDFKPGHWVGVQYDEPLGKNDGSCQGKRYFECPPNYGGFVRPRDVVTGDFCEEMDIEL